MLLEGSEALGYCCGVCSVLQPSPIVEKGRCLPAAELEGVAEVAEELAAVEQFGLDVVGGSEYEPVWRDPVVSSERLPPDSEEGDDYPRNRPADMTPPIVSFLGSDFLQDFVPGPGGQGESSLEEKATSSHWPSCSIRRLMAGSRLAPVMLRAVVGHLPCVCRRVSAKAAVRTARMVLGGSPYALPPYETEGMGPARNMRTPGPLRRLSTRSLPEMAAALRSRARCLDLAWRFPAPVSRPRSVVVEAAFT